MNRGVPGTGFIAARPSLAISPMPGAISIARRLNLLACGLLPVGRGGVSPGGLHAITAAPEADAAPWIYP